MMITRLEEMSLNAWPSIQQVLLDGWVLRFSQGYTRRANSVNPLYPGAYDVREKIAQCEWLYQQRGLPVVVKITSATQPAELDTLLQERDYGIHAATSVQTVAIDTIAATNGGDLEAAEDVTATWLDAYALFTGSPASESGPHRRILERISLPKCLALVRQQGVPVACGLGVLEDDYVGLFDIVTHPAHRRQGHAARLVAGIARWARRCGALHAYLQVMEENAPARRLYAKLGFRHAYSYWYRVKRP